MLRKIDGIVFQNRWKRMEGVWERKTALLQCTVSLCTDGHKGETTEGKHGCDKQKKKKKKETNYCGHFF